jgi:hypothetical protein
MASKTIWHLKKVLIIAPFCLNHANSANEKFKRKGIRAFEEDTSYWNRELNLFDSLDFRLAPDSLPPTTSSAPSPRPTVYSIPASSEPSEISECKVDVRIFKYLSW